MQLTNSKDQTRPTYKKISRTLLFCSERPRGEGSVRSRLVCCSAISAAHAKEHLLPPSRRLHRLSSARCLAKFVRNC